MKQENLVINIEKIVPNGYGLGFAEGLTVFVSLAAKGDKLLVRVREKKGKLAFAEILEVIEPSPDRVNPPCQYFGKCGGCDFQQMNYQAQLDAKIAIIQDCLRRIGKIDFQKEIQIIKSPNEYSYRGRAQWHADIRRKELGYFKRFSNQIIDVENCPILTQTLQNKMSELRQNLNWEEFWSDKIEIETAASSEKVSLYSSEIVEPTEEIFFETEGEKYFYDANTFFQGNPLLINELINIATKDAEGETALDLYCGVGLFSLPLARKFQKVIGIESNERSIEFARKNADLARLANLEFFDQSVSEWLIENKSQTADFVLLDPPRSGAESETLEALLKIKPRKISYVSCDPATLARDLKVLQNSYNIEQIVALDLFPQTHHVETIVELRLN